MRTTIERPFSTADLAATKLESFGLTELAAHAREGEEYGRSGKAALTLVRRKQLTVVLVALRAGRELREHKAPGPALVTVLSGDVEFSADGGVTVLGRGQAAAFSTDLPHAVTARGDADLLLVIGGHGGAGA